MELISMTEARQRLQTYISKTKPYEVTKVSKFENIETFNNLDRTGLQYNVKERRILIYESQKNEKIFFQYPGKESVRESGSQFPLDGRPMLQLQNGTIIPDMDFKKIWDIIDNVGKDHHIDMDLVATIFLKIAYMLDYKRFEKDYPFEDIDIATGQVVNSGTIKLKLNTLNIDEDVLYTLNDRLSFSREIGISLEGFLYYNDLLAQNEDCKYTYKARIAGETPNIKTGRINTCLSHLSIIAHIRGKMGISELINMFQRGRGVAPLQNKKISDACGNMVIIE